MMTDSFHFEPAAMSAQTAAIQAEILAKTIPHINRLVVSMLPDAPAACATLDLATALADGAVAVACCERCGTPGYAVTSSHVHLDGETELRPGRNGDTLCPSCRA